MAVGEALSNMAKPCSAANSLLLLVCLAEGGWLAGAAGPELAAPVPEKAPWTAGSATGTASGCLTVTVGVSSYLLRSKYNKHVISACSSQARRRSWSDLSRVNVEVRALRPGSTFSGSMPTSSPNAALLTWSLELECRKNCLAMDASALVAFGGSWARNSSHPWMCGAVPEHRSLVRNRLWAWPTLT